MKTKHYKFFTFFVFFVIFGASAHSEDLRKIVSLSGNWKFSIGDDSKWSSPSYDDSGWDQITVPEPWESQGYNDYNGYAWYRKSFRVREIPSNTTIYLLLGKIDDVDIVYLNGMEIGRSGKFPPDFKTAYDRDRRYIVPADLLKGNEENVISVRVYDSYLSGGITDGPTGIYVDEDNELLDLNLSGKWKFQTGNDKTWKSAEFNDEDWKTINVPSAWENQGYEDYDGYAWYRLKFSLPHDFNKGELYLSVGKIDDIDDVYLNGEHIGNVYDLRKKSWMGVQYTGWEWTMPRAYKIREGLLNRTGSNTIAVRVYDEQGLGGIYEGPIGIMSAENARKYKNKHHNNNGYNSFWEYMYDKFFGNDNSNND